LRGEGRSRLGCDEDAIMSEPPSARPRAVTRGLSEQQANVLLRLLWRSRLLQARLACIRGDFVSTSGKAWLAWKPGGEYGASREGYTRSDAASISRTLRRLSRRGLVEARNTISGGRRTTTVCLSPAGFDLAERLAKESWGEDWFDREEKKWLTVPHPPKC
jgi:hypothetical protein